MKRWEQLKEIEVKETELREKNKEVEKELQFITDSGDVLYFDEDGSLTCDDKFFKVKQVDLKAFVLWIAKCQEEI